LIDAPAQAGVRCGHGYRLAAGMTGRKHHYFFFVSSLSSLRALSIAGLGAKSSSSKSWRSSISHSAFSPCGTRDQVIAQGKRTVEHGTLSSGEFDARALQARLQPREAE
jgi:hypothetical protein